MNVHRPLRRPGWRASGAPLAVAALALVGCGGQQEAPDFDFHVPVSVADVVTGSVEDSVEATGSLRSAAEVSLTTEQLGVLRLGRATNGRRFEEGDRVVAGQVIATIEGDDGRLQARLDDAEARLEQARLEYRSQKRLYDEGIVDLLSVKSAEAKMVSAETDVEQARHTESKSSVVSPIGGVLIELSRNADGTPIADGQRVQSGFQIARVIDVGQLVAELDIAGGEIGRVRAGQSARIEHYAVDGQFDGRVARVSPVIDKVARTFRVDVEVRESSAELRPGMFVRAHIITERRDDVPVVPRHAVVNRGGETVVFLVEAQRAVRRRVVTGLGDDEHIEILEGIEAGDRLVTNGYETLVDGSRVRVTSG